MQVMGEGKAERLIAIAAAGVWSGPYPLSSASETADPQYLLTNHSAGEAQIYLTPDGVTPTTTFVTAPTNVVGAVPPVNQGWPLGPLAAIAVSGRNNAGKQMFAWVAHSLAGSVVGIKPISGG